MFAYGAVCFTVHQSCLNCWSGLNLWSLEAFTKYFLAYDKLNYARMTLLYLAEMKALKHTDPLNWEEFQNGNWVVNKTSIPFCAIEADHAIEHLNRGMEVAGGLAGITLNENAGVRFFLRASRLKCLTDEAKTMASVKSKSTEKHQSFFECTSHQVASLSTQKAWFLRLTTSWIPSPIKELI